MFLTRRSRQRPDFNKFPAQQLFLLAVIRLSEPIALTSIFPYAWKLVLHYNVGARSNASFYAGILISAFSLAEALTGMYWGAYSDRVGRKPILLLGCCGTMLSLVIVGFSQSFWVALFGRVVGGLLNGNIGVIQTMVGELTVNPKHEPKAFAVMPFVWSVGTIVGPTIGGYFAIPSENFPNLCPETSIFARFPFLLPNVICTLLILVSMVAGFFLLDETHPDMSPWSDSPSAPHADAQTPLIPAQAGTTTAAANLTQEASYGTFNNVTIDQTEEWIVKPDGRPSSISSGSDEKVFNKRIIMLTIALGIFTYHSMTYDHLLPIFLQDRRAEDIHIFSTNPLGGGLGLSIQQVGVIMSIQGLIALSVQAIVFPVMATWLGVWRVFTIVTVGHPIAYFIVPYLVYLPPHLVYPGIYTCLAVRNLLSILAYPVLLILIKEAAPSHSCLGKINGLAASTGAACRTMASPIAGYLYGVGMQIDFTAIAWFGSTLVALIGTVQCFFIRQNRSSEVHHVRAGAPCRFAPQETPKDVVHVSVQRVSEDGTRVADEDQEAGERSRLLA